VPRRKVAEPGPAAQPLRCEVCNEEVDRISVRHPPHGLRVGFCCIRMSSAELAVVYMRRLKGLAER
jgi:hypothetical protein